jgi:hypothetical protein
MAGTKSAFACAVMVLTSMGSKKAWRFTKFFGRGSMQIVLAGLVLNALALSTHRVARIAQCQESIRRRYDTDDALLFGLALGDLV